MAEVVATEELFWRLFTLYLMGALLLGGVASFILWFLAFRYKARSPEDVPPDAPRPGLIPSALLRTPSWSKLMPVSTGVIVTGLTLYSFIPLDYLSQTPVVQSPSLDGSEDKNLLYGLKVGSSLGYSSIPYAGSRPSCSSLSASHLRPSFSRVALVGLPLIHPLSW